MKNKLNISIIIPCRNEAEGIALLVKKALGIADEVIVVDNQSSDKTTLLAKKAGARVIKEARVNRLGIGYGYSLMRGMKAAKHEIIVTLDGDGTYPINQIKAALNFMDKKNIDMLLCNRFPLVDGQAISWWRQFGVWLLNTQVRFFYGYVIHDVLSGMWLVKKSVLTSLKLNEGGWNLSPEIKLAAIMNQKISVNQFHIHHYEREFGQSKQKLIITGLEHLWFIFVYRLKHLWVTSLKFVFASLIKPWKFIRDVRA